MAKRTPEEEMSERFAIWKDMMSMHKVSMNDAFHAILCHPGDVLLTMPMSELQGIQRRMAGLVTKLQEVAA